MADAGDTLRAAVTPAATPPIYVLWFDEIGSGDVARVGGKNASLGELVRNLDAIKVPPGFATTAEAYEELIATGVSAMAYETMMP